VFWIVNEGLPVFATVFFLIWMEFVQECIQNLLTDCSFRGNRLETAVISAIVGMDPTDIQEILPETSAEIVQIILR
jgi:hypothetical protein